MDTNRTPLYTLRQEVMSGKITYDKIVKRLSVAIEIEYMKRSPNVSLIKACEDLLWEIGTEGKQSFTSICEQCLEIVERYSPSNQQIPIKETKSLYFAKRFAIALIAFALLFFTTQGIINLGWFTFESTHDEQQYVIRGHSVNIELITRSIAEHNEFDSIQTHDWMEYTDFLGFAPTIADPSLFDAKDVLYIALIDSDVISLVIHYSGEKNTSAIMSIDYFIDPEEAYVTLEQNNAGTESLIGKTTIYCSTNIDKTSLTWMMNNTLYNIAGNVDKDDCIRFAEQLIGGNE